MTENISITIDGKTLEIKKPDENIQKFNKALEDPKNFMEFTKDPKKFSGLYGLTLDDDIAEVLKKQIGTVKNIKELDTHMSKQKRNATFAAIVVAWGYPVSAKVAIAF